MNAHTQQKQWTDFLAHSVPTRKHERFKHADFSYLKQQTFSILEKKPAAITAETLSARRLPEKNIFLVCVNGYFVSNLSDTQHLPKEVVVCSMQAARMHHADLLATYASPAINAEQFPFAHLNTTLFTDGLFLWVPENGEITIPMHILFITTENNSVLHPRHVFIFGKNSKTILFEENRAFTDDVAYMNNTVTTIFAEQAAHVEHYKLQHEGKHALHLAHTFVQQQQDSQLFSTTFSIGAQVARDETIVTLNGAGARFHGSGFYQTTRDQQYLDHHVEIKHIAPRTHSEMLYKGIVDKKSRAVFNGRLQVEKNAQKILAYQANHHLLLSPMAEAYSQPELEIYADDVQCKHGATTGQIDQDALFYLRARGIDEQTAMQLLLQGFTAEIIARVQARVVREYIAEKVGNIY